MLLGDIEKALRTKMGWGTPEVARRASRGGQPVKYQNIQQLEAKPDTSPRYLPGLAAAFEKSVDDLLAWRPGMPALGPNTPPRVSESVARYETAIGYVRFPLLEGFAGMGRGDYVGDYPEIVDWVEVTREWAAQKLRGIEPERIRVITGRGDSMRGQYNDGDLVFVDSSVKTFVGDSAYCYRWNGQVQIKRLQLIGPGRVRILSKNPDYPPIDAALADLEIGGRAVAAWTLQEF